MSENIFMKIAVLCLLIAINAKQFNCLFHLLASSFGAWGHAAVCGRDNRFSTII